MAIFHLLSKHFLLRKFSKVKRVMNEKYPDEFKPEVDRQVVKKVFLYRIFERLSISDRSLYYWITKAKVPDLS